MGRAILVVSFLLLFAISSVCYAQETKPDYVISNSANWQDVYSSMLYATITGSKGYFLVSARHSTLLLNQLSTQSKNILLVSSRRNPYMVGYSGILGSSGFTVDEISSDTANIDLAKRLTDVNRFLILDDSYGYNAISVAPYAALDKAYVLFTNRRNINQVYAFLKTKSIQEIIIYGQVDREVKDRLAEFNPTMISQGDRFDDNIKINELYQKKHNELFGKTKTQVILSNGEFIEQEIMSGVEPVIFIGRSNVPDQVRQYVQDSKIEIGILIGNELIGSATFVRRELGISVFVKFAQSARQPTGPISAVEDLDRFYLPRYILSTDIYKVSYNRLANRLEVTYQNLVSLATFLKGTITIKWGDQTQAVGEKASAIFIDKSEFKTIIYTAKADGSPIDPMTGDITADVFAIYGESNNSMEYTLRKTVNVDVVEFTDKTAIEIVSVRYDKRKGQFLIDIRNNGKVDAFVDVELIDLLVNDELGTYGNEGVAFIKVGETKTITIDVAMTDADMKNNPKVRVRAYYGERENSLINMIEGEYDYSFTGLAYMTGQLIMEFGRNAVIVAPLLIIIVLLVLILGMKKKCPKCGEINNLRAKKCKKCGNEI
jgi:hypothetical protein